MWLPGNHAKCTSIGSLACCSYSVRYRPSPSRDKEYDVIVHGKSQAFDPSACMLSGQ
jgi:hypothetical protein